MCKKFPFYKYLKMYQILQIEDLWQKDFFFTPFYAIYSKDSIVYRSQKSRKILFKKGWLM